MAVKLTYTAGDSNYLKVVLLDEVLHTPVCSYSKTEGKFINLILTSRDKIFLSGGELHLSLPDGTHITSANEVCKYLCSEAGQKTFSWEDTTEQALADQWMSWETNKLQVLLSTCIIIKYIP